MRGGRGRRRYHSGKYFTTLESEDWNAEGRPTLRVRWGDP